VGNESDQALLERYRNGDRAAFTELVVRYQRPLYNAAFWVLRSVEDANDITQIVFLKVAEQLDDYDPQYKFFSWIYRIAVNESLDIVGRRRREAVLDDSVPVPAVDPGAERAEAERAELVQRALMDLKPGERAIIVLKHFRGLSYPEIAEILGIPEKKVKSRLFEARERLRRVMRQRGWLS
jgi:RNA polymerase sigma-70 factor (ECF subfamily)